MKNNLNIDEIVGIIANYYQKDKKFEQYKLLLLDSGINKEDSQDFFIYPEGESFPSEISTYAVREKLRDEKFLTKLATNLYALMDDDKKKSLMVKLVYKPITKEQYGKINKEQEVKPENKKVDYVKHLVEDAKVTELKEKIGEKKFWNLVSRK